MLSYSCKSLSATYLKPFNANNIFNMTDGMTDDQNSNERATLNRPTQLSVTQQNK